MMDMKKVLLAALVCAGSMTGRAQQDIHLSQFFASPLFMNPATAGAFNGDLRAAASFRNQWGSVANPYNTITVAADMAVFSPKNSNDFFAAGINFFSDLTGLMKMNTNLGGLSLAYAVNVADDGWLSGGLNFGFMQRAVNTGGINWDNQWNGAGFDQNLSSGEAVIADNFTALDLSAGIHYFYDDGELSYFGGASVGHINRPDVNFLGNEERLKLKFIVHGGAELPLGNTNTRLKPNAMVMLQGPNRVVNIGTDYKIILREGSRTLTYNDEVSASIGAYYRLQDALFAVAGFQYAGFSLGVSYDFTLSQLTNATSGLAGPEIFLGYIARFGNGSGVSSFR